MSKKPKYGELTACIKEALSRGIGDTQEIKAYLKERGLTASDPLISVVKSGKQCKKLCIPYTSFKEDKHVETFFNLLGALQEWVGDDKLFVQLLKTHVEVIEGMEA